MLLAARRGIKLSMVCLSIYKGCFMSDSSFVVKLALIKIMIKPAKDGSAGVAINSGSGDPRTRGPKYLQSLA